MPLELHDGWHYRITNRKSGTTLDLSGADNRSIIGYREKEGADNQVWQLRHLGGDKYLIRNKTGPYLGLPQGFHANDGISANAVHQEFVWQIYEAKDDTEAATIRVPDTWQVLDLADHGNAADGTPVTTWGAWDGKNQQWHFRAVPG